MIHRNERFFGNLMDSVASGHFNHAIGNDTISPRCWLGEHEVNPMHHHADGALLLNKIDMRFLHDLYTCCILYTRTDGLQSLSLALASFGQWPMGPMGPMAGLSHLRHAQRHQVLISFRASDQAGQNVGAPEPNLHLEIRLIRL